MILNTIDTETKTIYHEIEQNNNFNTISIMDYNLNQESKKIKVNNSQTIITDMCIINEESFLLCYYHNKINKIIVKVININGLKLDLGPMCIVDEKTNSSVMSVISISKDRAILTYNDNFNKVGKILYLKINNNQIYVIEKYIFANDIVPELSTFKINDTQYVMFYQLNNCGVMRLTDIERDKIFLKNEQIFYKGSNLWGLSVNRVHDYFILIFINNQKKLVMKILSADNKLTFTSGSVYNKPVENGFELISIDNEFCLCYFNGIVQIISIINGQVIQPENF